MKRDELVHTDSSLFYEKRTISSDGFAQDASRNTP